MTLSPHVAPPYDSNTTSSTRSPSILSNPRKSPTLPTTNAVATADVSTDKPQTFMQTMLTAPNSYFSGVFNLANSTIGAGVLLLPSVFKEAGIILGVLLLVCGAVLAAITLNLLHKVWVKVQSYDSSRKEYEDVGNFLFGKWMGVTVSISVIIINVGACISYLIIMSHLMTPVTLDIISLINPSKAKDIAAHHPDILSGIVTAVLAVPSITLSCLPNIADLRFFSYISLSSVLLFILMVIVGLVSGYTSKLRSGHVKLFVVSWDLFPLLGIITFAFACHTNMCPISATFGKEKEHRAKWSIAGSTLTCLLTFTLIGVTGYLSFLDNTCADIVQSYPAESIIDSILRCILGLSLVLTYPLAAYPARVSIDCLLDDLLHPKQFIKDCAKCCVGARMIKKGCSDIPPPNHDQLDHLSQVFDEEAELNTDATSEYGERSEISHTDIYVHQKKPMRGPFKTLRRGAHVIRTTPVKSYPSIILQCIRNNVRNVLEGLILGIFALSIAIFYPYASVLFGLVGSSGSTMCSYIFPTVFYLIVYRPSWKNPMLYLTILILLFGMGFGLFVTASNFVSIINGTAQKRDC